MDSDKLSSDPSSIALHELNPEELQILYAHFQQHYPDPFLNEESFINKEDTNIPTTDVKRSANNEEPEHKTSSEPVHVTTTPEEPKLAEPEIGPGSGKPADLKSEPETTPEPKTGTIPESEPAPAPAPEHESESEPESEHESELEPESEHESESEPELVSESEPEPEPEPEPKRKPEPKKPATAKGSKPQIKPKQHDPESSKPQSHPEDTANIIEGVLLIDLANPPLPNTLPKPHNPKPTTKHSKTTSHLNKHEKPNPKVPLSSKNLLSPQYQLTPVKLGFFFCFIVTWMAIFTYHN